MANDYFEFKQFKIEQKRSPMKVGTDGVLIGCWAKSPVNFPERILDIGSGTGLISLISCQRFHSAKITGIEIYGDAIAESKLNVANSPWPQRISILHQSLEEFANSSKDKFDIIISNPPFYNTFSKSGKCGRDTARHADSLPVETLLKYGMGLLSPYGYLNLIYPFCHFEQIESICNRIGLHINSQCFVKPTPEKNPKRVMISASTIKKPVVTATIIIEDKGRHHYSTAYKKLTKNFYLSR